MFNPNVPFNGQLAAWCAEKAAWSLHFGTQASVQGWRNVAHRHAVLLLTYEALDAIDVEHVSRRP